MKHVFMPWLVLKPVLMHSLATFESLLDNGGTRNLILSILGVVIFWHIYTPIHELLHVAGCLIGGGTVQELALSPQYGGTLLQHIFPFIVPESEYAGQLTGFTTPNDLVYFFVDMLPYVLSLFGIALIEWSRRKGMAPFFGLGIILAYVPFMSVPGDYYEAVSLMTTRIAEAMQPSLESRILVSDDVFRSIGDLSEAGLLNGVTGSLVALGIVLAIYLTLITLALQLLIARRFFGPEFPAEILAAREEQEAKRRAAAALATDR